MKSDYFSVTTKEKAYIVFGRRSLVAETGVGHYGPALLLTHKGQTGHLFCLTRGEARRLARAILKLTESRGE